MNGWTMAVCDVCCRLDNDYRQKPCTWCGTCRAWLCQADAGNMARRAKAMMKRAIWG